MFIIVNDDLNWLCYDGLFEDYYFKSPHDHRAMILSSISKEYLQDIKQKVGNVKVMKFITVPLDEEDWEI